MTLILAPKKRLLSQVTRNTQMKYESSITYQSKVMANVKVFADKQMDKETSEQGKCNMPQFIDLMTWPS